MHPIRFILSVIVLSLGLATQAAAQCDGTDLRTTLTPSEQKALRAAVADTPYPAGTLWRAQRGDAVIHLIGTIHLDDPRLEPRVTALRGLVENAATLLLEIAPADEARLQAELTGNPEMLLLTEATLPELMEEDAWQALSQAVSARGIPPFMAAKFQPWYLSMLLGIPACAMADVSEKNGLDARLADLANAAGVPMASLEPFDTIFKAFGGAPLDEQIAMIESTLVAPNVSEDMFATVLAGYFSENTAESWELSKLLARRYSTVSAEESNAMFAEMEEMLLTARNRAWMPVILEAAGPQPIVVAAGAGHLPGEAGLLNLLAQEGFALTRIPY